MGIRSFLSGVDELSPGQVRQYLDSHAADQYTLLDVREVSEYQSAHLPGATLIPISQLADRLAELDPHKAVIAY